MQLPTINSERLKKIKLKYVLAGLVLLILLIGGGVGFYLAQQQQEIRQQAAVAYADCPNQNLKHGQTICSGFQTIQQCQNGALVNYLTCGAGKRCAGTPNAACVDSGSPVPTPGGSCQGTVCTSPGGGCIAIHTCDQLDSNGHCTVLNPQVTTGTVNAQQIANQTCKCVQVDVLNGQNNSCVNGHINGDPSTLIGNSNICPNVPCAPVNPTPSPGTGGPDPSPQPSPQPSPTPGVTPSPVVSPTPGVTPSPEVTPTPGVTPSPQVSPSPTPVCGSSCSTTSECPQDHTCSNGTCQLTACVNGATCDSSSCRVTTCGSTCSTSTDCPNDHTCNNGVCKLNACLNGSSCSSDACRVTACGSSCSSNSDCPNDHTCNGGTCKLTACVNGSSCDSNQCTVLTPSPVPSPVLGCNDVCVNNSDCKSSNHICVDTSSGRRCRLETNITSDSCSAPGQTVAQGQSQPQQPSQLPVAGSSDIIKALGIGVLAIILGIVGFLAL